MASLDVSSTRSRGQTDFGFDPTWGATFSWARYGPSTKRNHCLFCWGAFAEPGDKLSDALDQGYVTVAPRSVGDDCLWVCDSCFHEQREEFAWQVADSDIAPLS